MWKRCGRCKLQNVKVLNKGIDWDSKNNIYWKHDVQRVETLKIILQGNAEFEATNVIFKVLIILLDCMNLSYFLM